MSVTGISPLSTGATTSYESYLLRQEQIASSTQEQSYLRLLNAPLRNVPALSTSATLNSSLSSALNASLSASATQNSALSTSAAQNAAISTSATQNSALSTSAALNSATTNAASAITNADNGLNGSLFSALAAQFDVTSQLGLNTAQPSLSTQLSYRQSPTFL